MSILQKTPKLNKINRHSIDGNFMKKAPGLWQNKYALHEHQTHRPLDFCETNPLNVYR